MHALMLFLALIFAPAQQDTLTIRDCILREGMSSALTGPATFNAFVGHIATVAVYAANNAAIIEPILAQRYNIPLGE